MASVGAHLFQPGQSGNPAGRPAGVPNKANAVFREIAQTHTPEALAALLEVINDKKAFSTARVKAAEVVLGYAYGRPSQSIDATINGGTAFLELLRLVNATEVGASVVEIEGQPVDIRDGSAESSPGAVANGSAEPDSDPGPDSD